LQDFAAQLTQPVHLAGKMDGYSTGVDEGLRVRLTETLGCATIVLQGTERVVDQVGGRDVSASETTRVTLVLPTEIYQEIASAKERQETRSVAGFIREAVEEKVDRMRWQRNLEELRRDIRESGGLELQGSKEEVIERLRETRRQIFEAEYAHLY
jgi:hypothetical protein